MALNSEGCCKEWMSPRMYTNPLTQESGQHLKGRNSLMGSGGKRLKVGQELGKQHCSLSDPSPTYSPTTQWSGLPHPGKYPSPHSLQHNRCTETKKYGPNERTDKNYRKRTKQQGDSQPIRCRVQNTGNQDAHRNGWVGFQNKGKYEGYAKWNKEKYTGNQQWRERNWDSNQRFGTEGKNKHSVRIE